MGVRGRSPGGRERWAGQTTQAFKATWVLLCPNGSRKLFKSFYRQWDMVRYAFPEECSDCRMLEGAQQVRVDRAGDFVMIWGENRNLGGVVVVGMDWRCILEVELPEVVDRLDVGGMKESRVSRTWPGFGAWHLEVDGASSSERTLQKTKFRGT